MDMKKNPLSFQLDLKPEDFLPASKDEQESLVVMRESVSFWKDGLRRFRKNKIAMVSLVVILIIMFFAFIVPMFYPYSYEQQVRGSENLAPMEYSAQELERIAAGESVFPHIAGTDKLGRDYAIRLMIGARISLLVGIVASAMILVIGSIYGSISAFFGGWVDMIMMRITDIIYTIPDILLIILLGFALKAPLESLAAMPGFGWLQTLGPNLVSIFIVFALLGQHGPYRAQPDPDPEGGGVCHRRPGPGCLQRPHHQKAPAHQLHRYPDRYHHSADPLVHLHRELHELPGHGRCGSPAQPGQPGHRCAEGYEHLSSSAVPACCHHQHHHPELQPAGRRPA